MRFLVFADVHGNLPGMERVLLHRARHDIECLVFLGDVIGYNGFPEECTSQLQTEGVQAIKGNHEALFLGELPFSTCTNPIAPHTLKVTRSLLSARSVSFLASLPQQIRLNEQALLVHGSLYSIHEYINRADKVRANLERLRGIGGRVLFFAHTHRPTIYVADSEIREIRSISPSEPLTLRDDRYYLINPGTAGERRGRNRTLSFLVYDDASNHVEFVSFLLSPSDTERLRRRNREVFGPLALISGMNRFVGLGRKVVRKLRHHARQLRTPSEPHN